MATKFAPLVADSVLQARGILGQFCSRLQRRCKTKARQINRRMGSDAGDVHTAALEMDEEQHIVGHQPSQRENLDSKELESAEFSVVSNLLLTRVAG